jgi:hypothetical protein
LSRFFKEGNVIIPRLFVSLIALLPVQVSGQAPPPFEHPRDAVLHVINSVIRAHPSRSCSLMSVAFTDDLRGSLEQLCRKPGFRNLRSTFRIDPLTGDASSPESYELINAEFEGDGGSIWVRFRTNKGARTTQFTVYLIGDEGWKVGDLIYENARSFGQYLRRHAPPNSRMNRTPRT